MQESTKKFIGKYWSGILFVISFIGEALTNIFSEEIKHFLLQIDVNLPKIDIITVIFTMGMIIGGLALILSLQKSMSGIKFYYSRKDLPKLEKFLSDAKDEIIIFGTSLEKIMLEPSIIINKIEQNVHVTFLLLSDTTEFFSKYKDDILCGAKASIPVSLERICGLKKGLSKDNQDKFHIKIYDYPLFNSAIIYDPNANGKILIEPHLYKLDTELRPSVIITKKKKEELFMKYWNHYNYILLKHAKEYQCKPD